MKPDKGEKLSRWQLEMFVRCPRCFWLLKRHGIKQPATFPLALNTAMDHLLKVEFDDYRRQGKPHPVQQEHFAAREDGTLSETPCGAVEARLFRDQPLLNEWRNNRRGIRWVDPLTEYTLFGAIDDLFEFPDGSLAVLDYKSSGAAAIKLYPSYQLQIDVYTFLLQQNGYRTDRDGYVAFFVAVKEDGFAGRLPFRGTLVRVSTQTERVRDLFREAVALAESQRMPESGEECDLCRWFDEADAAVNSKRQAG